MTDQACSKAQQEVRWYIVHVSLHCSCESQHLCMEYACTALPANASHVQTATPHLTVGALSVTAGMLVRTVTTNPVWKDSGFEVVCLSGLPNLLIALQRAPWKDILLGTAAAVVLQLMLGLPFLLQHPYSYLNKAFEFSRVFLLQWSVNWSFLPEDIFRSKFFAACLLLAHLCLLLLFAHCKWCGADGGLIRLFVQRLQGKAIAPASGQKSGDLQAYDAKQLLAIVFSGNLIGIVCARTLHFQFYSWYFHTLPLLLWHAKLSIQLRIVLLGCIEVVWNSFPPSVASSCILLSCHCILLFGLYHLSDWSRPRLDVKST